MSDENENLPLRLLCVDHDPDFVTYFLSSTESLDFSIEACCHVKEAREKIKSTSYDAFVLDTEIDFIKEIRETEKKASIAVISENYRDEENFRFLKEECEIDYVLDKPIDPEQIEGVCVQLSKGRPSLTETPDTHDRLQALKDKYDKEICNTIVLLIHLVRSVQEDPDKNRLEALQRDVHKVAGSAGSFGYPKISEICKILDSDLREKLTSEKMIEESWLSSLDVFLKEVKFYFQIGCD